MDGAANFYRVPVPSAPAHAAVTPPTEPAAGRSLPFAGWPAKNDLEYIKTMIELLVLLLAVPWLIARLARNPKAASRRAATRVGG